MYAKLEVGKLDILGQKFEKLEVGWARSRKSLKYEKLKVESQKVKAKSRKSWKKEQLEVKSQKQEKLEVGKLKVGKMEVTKLEVGEPYLQCPTT